MKRRIFILALFLTLFNIFGQQLNFYNNPYVTCDNKIYQSGWSSNNWTEARFSPAPGNITSLSFYNNPYVVIGDKIYQSGWSSNNWTEAPFSPVLN